MLISETNKTIPSASMQSNQPQDNIKVFVKAMRSQAQDFSDRDLATEFNMAAEKNSPCQMGSQKQPSTKLLKSIENDLKEMNANVGGTAHIANEYAKLLHNQRHLDTGYRKIQEQTFINTLREGNQPEDTTPDVALKLPYSATTKQPTEKTIPHAVLTAMSSIPSGSIKASETHFELNNQPQFEYTNPSASYSLAPSPDIFSSPKIGTSVSYRIVPLNLMAGA